MILPFISHSYPRWALFQILCHSIIYTGWLRMGFPVYGFYNPQYIKGSISPELNIHQPSIISYIQLHPLTSPYSWWLKPLLNSSFKKKTSTKHHLTTIFFTISPNLFPKNAWWFFNPRNINHQGFFQSSAENGYLGVPGWSQRGPNILGSPGSVAFPWGCSWDLYGDSLYLTSSMYH